MREGSGPHELALATTLRLVPDLRAVQVLDVACGQGLAARALARARAASVTGVDLTAELIEIARGYEAGEPLGIRYLLDDAQALATLGGAAFDVVTCQLGLMDIPGLREVMGSVARVLRPGGSFVFVIGHPCFLAPNARTVPAADGRAARLISEYFHQRFWRSASPAGVRRVGNHHRTVASYLNTLTACGFTLDLVDEPPASGLLAVDQPVYRNVPIFFAARATRRS
jgi:ubiquinone/menaquinone biosynthesis C-methylase UbiE